MKENLRVDEAMKTNNFKKLYRVDEVADILNCSSRSVYRLISDGELRAFRIRSSLRVSREGLDLFIRRQIQKFQEEEGLENDFSVTGVDSLAQD